MTSLGEFGGTDDGLSNEEALSRPKDVRVWTNADVLKWLIDVDQKQYIPAFIAQNVTGSVMVQAVLDSNPLQLNDVVGSDAGDLSLMGLKAHMEQACGEVIEDADQDGMINGWGYEEEVSAWYDIWGMDVLADACDAVRQDFSQKQNRLAVASLVLSTILSTVSVASLSSSQDDGGQSDAHVAYMNYGFTVISITLTIITGYSKLFDFGSKVDGLKKLSTVIHEHVENSWSQLSRPPHKRKSRDEYETGVRDVDLQVAHLVAQVDIPRLEMRGLTRIYRTDKSTWEDVAGLFWDSMDKHWLLSYVPFTTALYIENQEDMLKRSVRNARLQVFSSRNLGRHFPEQAVKDREEASKWEAAGDVFGPQYTKDGERVRATSVTE